MTFMLIIRTRFVGKVIRLRDNTCLECVLACILPEQYDEFERNPKALWLFSAEGPSGPPSEAMHSKTFGLYGVCVKHKVSCYMMVCVTRHVRSKHVGARTCMYPMRRERTCDALGFCSRRA